MDGIQYAFASQYASGDLDQSMWWLSSLYNMYSRKMGNGSFNPVILCEIMVLCGFLNWRKWGSKLEKEGGIGNWLMERQKQVVREGELQGISTEIPHDLGADNISKLGWQNRKNKEIQTFRKPHQWRRLKDKIEKTMTERWSNYTGMKFSNGSVKLDIFMFSNKKIFHNFIMWQWKKKIVLGLLLINVVWVVV